MKTNYLAHWGAAILLLTGCSSKDPGAPEIPDEDQSEQPEVSYSPPTYTDDYYSIAGWDERAKWNLANVHDPTVEKCGDYYYMYGTDASYGNALDGHGHFPYRRSKDLVNWEFRGTAITKTPTWVSDTLQQMRTRAGLPFIEQPVYGYWAPVVRKAGNKYRMYYSIVVDNYIRTGLPNNTANFDGSWTEHAFIGLMETDDLANNLWIDRGMVVCSVSDKGQDWTRKSLNDWNAYFKWNAIDPTYIINPEGEHWLIYGSWHSGIVALSLDQATGKPNHLGDLPDYGTCIARRDANSQNRWQGQEAPEIIYNAATGYYYLFLAYDDLSVGYNTRVCRSKNITGPYLGIDGRDISSGGECWPLLIHPYRFNDHSGWEGISHCALFKDPDTDNWYYTSQARLPAGTGGNAYSNAIMMGQVRQVRWTDSGWPVLMPERYAAVPEQQITETEIAGNWEHIRLNYQYQVQQTSQILSLSTEHQATGALTGSWNYDATKKQLHIGEVTLLVERGLDWESQPRKTTLIYAGLSADGRSLWGKKSE